MPFNTYKLRASSLKALTAQGIAEPTAIQAQAIPALLEGRDVLGQAQTGSGKTLAFALPMIEICEADKKTIQALVLVPTRELAVQVGGVIQSLAAPAGLSVVVVYGGVGYVPQTDAFRRGVQIVVATPGRLIDHLQRGSLRLENIRMLVLDEADQMLDKGFGPEVERIIGRTPASRQTALFSATTPPWVQNVAAKFLLEPLILEVDTLDQEPDIEHSVIEVWNGDKIAVLMQLLSIPSHGATLVFGRTRHGVANLARRLKAQGFETEALQGDLGQQARERIIQQFRSGRLPILVATNVAARGLDMLNITTVINYDMPESSELFVHRVGRTGRMGRSGQALTLVTSVDLSKLQEIERHLGRKLPRLTTAQVRTLFANAASSEPKPVQPQPRTPVLVAEPVSAPATAQASEVKRRMRRRRRSGLVANAAPAMG